jgi:hypothetical protein
MDQERKKHSSLYDPLIYGYKYQVQLDKSESIITKFRLNYHLEEVSFVQFGYQIGDTIQEKIRNVLSKEHVHYMNHHISQIRKKTH